MGTAAANPQFPFFSLGALGVLGGKTRRLLDQQCGLLFAPEPAMTTPRKPDSDVYDVAIVGGGPAGLSAALWLARYLHSVVVIDSGDPRNWETRGVNGFLGSQGIKSPDLRKRGREDAESFGAKFAGDRGEPSDCGN